MLLASVAFPVRIFPLLTCYQFPDSLFKHSLYCMLLDWWSTWRVLESYGNPVKQWWVMFGQSVYSFILLQNHLETSRYPAHYMFTPLIKALFSYFIFRPSRCS